ncbi:LptF/LptG family permease [Candidatus Pelagibacter sp.]|nr:LptF/LptG family permease [Candidatus Pelagibacter sp.]
MIKAFEYYLIKLFIKKILNISLIFLSLIFILSIFDEISFFKDLDVSFYFPFFLTLLNVPSTLFEIFPFIFLISTQLFFVELIAKNELEIFKVNGTTNLKIIQIIFFTSLISGILLSTLFYNFSSKFKFLYLDLKNNYSNDNKYLAVVNENGLWIKDEINEKIFIINAMQINNNILNEVTISEFNNKFELSRIIQSSSIEISSKRWVISNPTISINNKTQNLKKEIFLTTHFDEKKINGLFRNLGSLSIGQLLKLNKDYESLGYSTTEVKNYLYKLLAFPVYLSIMVLLASIIMFNIKRNKSLIFSIILGILSSVLIYYIYYLFNFLGESEKIPIFLAAWLPLLILVFIISIGLLRINEK